MVSQIITAFLLVGISLLQGPVPLSKISRDSGGVWLRMYLLETSRALNISPTWARMAWGTSVLQLCSTKTNMSHSVILPHISFHICRNNSMYLGNSVKAGSPLPPLRFNSNWVDITCRYPFKKMLLMSLLQKLYQYINWC